MAVLKHKLEERFKNPFAGSQGTAPGLDPDAVQKLRALGYFAYRSAMYRSSFSSTALASGLPNRRRDCGSSTPRLRQATHSGRMTSRRAKQYWTRCAKRIRSNISFPSCWGKLLCDKNCRGPSRLRSPGMLAAESAV